MLWTNAREDKHHHAAGHILVPQTIVILRRQVTAPVCTRVTTPVKQLRAET